MANRGKPCLHSVIFDKQSVLIEGRLLTDNVLITFEINNYIKRKTQGHCGVAGLKVDVSKAYDRLEWDYIKMMWCKFGFPYVWNNRVILCVRSVSYSFQHDEKVFGNVNPQR